MSAWVPTAMPPTVEELWLPRGHDDKSINPYLVSCLEEALEKRREEVRQTAARMAMGTHRAMAFRPATAAEVRGDQLQQGADVDEDMDTDRPDDDELASDEMSDDGDFGTPMQDMAAVDDAMDDLAEDDSDDPDDDDDLAGYL